MTYALFPKESEIRFLGAVEEGEVWGYILYQCWKREFHNQLFIVQHNFRLNEK